MAEDQGPNAVQNAAAPKKKKKKRGKFLLVVLVLLVAAAGAAAAFTLSNPGGEKPDRKAEKPAVTKTMSFGSLVVNLTDPPGSRYFRVALTLEYVDSGTLETELKEKEHRIRDGLVFLLRQKSSFDLKGPEVPETIREEVLHEINRHLEKGEIKEVYFTEFLIQ
ncbi:MAG: flagellar basal body-associated FliL family protein [Bacillota bacterium]